MCKWLDSVLYVYISFFCKVFSGLLFIINGFVPDITTWKNHEQIIEGGVWTEDQRNKQEAEKKTAYLRGFVISSARQQGLG
jgi:hypothetical protein